MAIQTEKRVACARLLSLEKVKRRSGSENRDFTIANIFYYLLASKIIEAYHLGNSLKVG
jgi:hypothetical protein